MGLSKDKLVFDETAIADSDQVGAHILGSSSLKVTSTTVGPKEALDVNIVAAPGEGIYAEDSAHISGDMGQFILVVRNDNEGSLTDTDGDYSALQVDSIGRLRILNKAEYQDNDTWNSQDVGLGLLGVRRDANTTIAEANGTYAPLNLNSTGRLKTNIQSEYLEDTPHASGDQGVFILSRRRDAYASSSDTQNDYSTFNTDEFGRLWTNHSFQDPSGPTYGSTPVDNTVGGTLLSVRPNGAVKVIYQNVGNKECFIGRDTSVLTTTGLRLAPGASIELDAAQGVDFYGITASGTTDIRYMDFS